MKVYKTLTIIFIIISVILIIIAGANSIIKSIETNHKQQLQFESEQRSNLQDEAYKNSELQYELMLQTIKDNSDYYLSFSKEFLSEFEKYGYDEWYEKRGNFDFYKVSDKLEIEYNVDLLGIENDCCIRNIEGIVVVYFEKPYTIKGIFYTGNALDYYEYVYYCSVIYVPDEYINSESIAILNREIFGFTDENIGDNLFIVVHPIMNY
jgi:hypothetical protein